MTGNEHQNDERTAADDTADEMQERLDQLGEHLDEARDNADEHHRHARGEAVADDEKDRRDAPLGARPDDDGPAAGDL